LTFYHNRAKRAQLTLAALPRYLAAVSGALSGLVEGRGLIRKRIRIHAALLTGVALKSFEKGREKGFFICDGQLWGDRLRRDLQLLRQYVERQI
jgi:hypothetical protein